MIDMAEVSSKRPHSEMIGGGVMNTGSKCRLSMVVRGAVLSVLGFLPVAVWAGPPGSPLLEPILVNELVDGPVRRGLPQVAADSSGDFAVVWADASSTPREVRARSFARSGSPQSSTTFVAMESGDSSRPDQLAVNDFGDAVIVYKGLREPLTNPLQPPPNAIWAQRLGRDGLLVGQPILVAEQPPRFGLQSGRIGVPSVAMNNAGEFLVAWQETRYSGYGGVATLFSVQTSERIFARRFAADGTSLGSTKLVGQRLLGPHLEEFVRVASHASGQFVVAYAASPVSGNISPRDQPAVFPFYGRIFGAGGDADGLPFHFGDGYPDLATYGDVDFDVAFSSNGDLVLAWAQADQRYTPSSETIRLRHFNRLGVPTGAAVEVATRGAVTSRASLSLAPLPAGGVAIVWPDRIGNATGTAYGRYYAADDSPLTDPFVIATGVRTVSADTDGAGNLIAVYGETDVYARVFQGP